MRALAYLLLAIMFFLGGAYTQFKYGKPSIRNIEVMSVEVIEVPVITDVVVEVPTTVIVWKEPKQCTID